MLQVLTSPPFLMVTAFLGAGVMVAWRMREARGAVTLRKIVIPPLGMSTGFCMFLAPQTRVPVPWGLAAFLVGALFLSYPLVHTSRLTRSGEHVLLKRSPAFMVILLALIAVRLLLRSYVEQYVDAIQTGSLVFLLAFGMLLPWRVVMYLRYRALTRDVQSGSTRAA